MAKMGHIFTPLEISTPFRKGRIKALFFPWGFMIILFILSGCASPSPDFVKVKELKEQSLIEKGVNKAGKEKIEDKPYIKLNFKMKDSSVEVFLDPNMINTYLDIEWEEKPTEEEEKKKGLEKEVPQEKPSEKAEEKVNEDFKKIMENLQELKKEIADKKVEKPAGLPEQAQMPQTNIPDKKPETPIEQPQTLQPDITEKKPEKEVGEKIQESIEQTQKTNENLPNDVLIHIHNAQKSFYSKNYELALKEVEDAQSISETAIGYALKGSILYKMGKIEGAIYNWKKALQLNPQMSEVEEILSQF